MKAYISNKNKAGRCKCCVDLKTTKRLLYIMGEMLGYTPNTPKGPIKPSSNNYSHYRNISSNLTYPVRVWSGHVYCELFNQTSNINKIPTGNVTGLRGCYRWLLLLRKQENTCTNAAAGHQELTCWPLVNSECRMNISALWSSRPVHLDSRTTNTH